MIDIELEDQAERLAQKIKHYIITGSGHTFGSSTIEEFYQAFCTSLREEVMINWMAGLDTIKEKKVRVAHYISMEYLPGRQTFNNFSNIGATELVRAVLAKLNRNLSDLLPVEPDPSLGNGGLGRLASCFLDSLATLHYPARAYGLRYQYGIFEQEIWDGVQIERPDCWLLNLNPWEVRRDAFATHVPFGGKMVQAKNSLGEEAYLLEDADEVRALPYDFPVVGFAEKGDFTVIPLRLWSTKESPRNFQLQRYNAGLIGQAAENVSLTDVLYPNDKTIIGQRLRLKQEFLLVCASLQDLIRRHMLVYGDMSHFADKVRIQINDTHPALIVAELIRTLTKNHDFSWRKAVDTCVEVCSYTNHTILREALEEWDEAHFRELIPRQYQIIERLNQEFCDNVREKFPNDEDKIRRLSIMENGKVRMAHLSIVGSHKVNGVAQLHSDILKKFVFKDFVDMFPDRFMNVTNGVTHRRWLLHANPLLAEFISKRIGKGWIHDFKEIAKLRAFAADRASQEEFLTIKRENKQALNEFLLMENPIRSSSGALISHTRPLPPSALFDVQVKRFHEYKRQHMNALHLIMLYQELKADPQARKISRFALFGGKAAPGYERAKQIIELISAIGRKIEKDPAVRQKLAVCFVENYNVSKAELIIPAADLSEQISTAGWEASGTGNMKFAMNGALTIGTDDGANIEMRQAVTDEWWPFKFGATAEENREPFNPADVADAPIHKALDALKDGTFAETEEQNAAFSAIYHTVFDKGTFSVVRDLRAYYECQKRVEELFSEPLAWAEYAIHNIAGMGPFSTDESIHGYAEEIWGISPCPLDPVICAKVREEYSMHDRCRIVPRNGI